MAKWWSTMDLFGYSTLKQTQLTSKTLPHEPIIGIPTSIFFSPRVNTQCYPPVIKQGNWTSPSDFPIYRRVMTLQCLTASQINLQHMCWYSFACRQLHLHIHIYIHKYNQLYTLHVTHIACDVTHIHIVCHMKHITYIYMCTVNVTCKDTWSPFKRSAFCFDAQGTAERHAGHPVDSDQLCPAFQPRRSPPWECLRAEISWGQLLGGFFWGSLDHWNHSMVSSCKKLDNLMEAHLATSKRSPKGRS